MKRAKLLLIAAVMSIFMCITAFAGEWKQDTNGWWYQNGDGSYLKNGWFWIDGNGDGISECYWFTEDGFCLTDATTPDGHTVNESGAMTVDGVVQTKSAVTSAVQAPAPVPETTGAAVKTKGAAVETTAARTVSGISATPYDGYTIVVNTGTKKYHVPTCKSVSQMKEKNKGYCSDTSYLTSHGYSACKNCH